MMELKPWTTLAGAVKLTGRSARTIRRWRAQGRVRTSYLDGTTRLYSTVDLLDVEQQTTLYREGSFVEKAAAKGLRG